MGGACCNSMTAGPLEFLSVGGHMFEVYLSDRRDLLVLKKGSAIPLFRASGKWRKQKKNVLRVSDEIEAAVQMHGYYVRKLTEAKPAMPRSSE
jgi:hypothetical protein